MKRCPNPECPYEVGRRKCPAICPLCKAMLGPGPAPKPQRKKKSKKTLHPTVEIEPGIYSVQYHQHNRCLVKIFPEETTDRINHCDHSKCTELRRKSVRNGTAFNCSHVEKVKLELSGDQVFPKIALITAADISPRLHHLPADARTDVTEYMAKVACFKVIRVTESCFLVRTPPSNHSNMSYVHVHLKKDNAYHCAIGSKCIRYKVTVAKKTVSTSLCVHEHLATVLSRDQDPVLPGDQDPELSGVQDPALASTSGLVGDKLPYKPRFNQSDWMRKTSEYIFRNRSLDLTKTRKKEIEHKILALNISGWPKIFEPFEEICPRCLTPLQPPKQHPGVEYSDLLTRDSLESVTVLVRKCPSCAILFQANHECLLNIGDSLLVTLDIIFLMMGIVHSGSPLSTIAEVLLSNISLRNERLDSLSVSKKEWIGRLLYKGYLAVECLDKNAILDQICGLCGINPEAILGDGGEDVSCVLEDYHLDVTRDDNGQFDSSYVETFLDELKIFFVGGLVYPRLHMSQRFPMNLSTVPPFLLAPYRADKIYNTEQEKDTRFTDAKAVRGNQQLLMDQIENETVNIKTLNSLKKDQLNRVLLSIGFEKAELSRFPSNLARCDAIFTLYKSIESGYSQCHATGNRKKASGGWYNESCMHGIITASKMLFLSESVRDVMDIKLSKKINPPVNILDTPCTAASHLITRDPATAKAWFGKRRGCFEKPTLSAPPKKVSVPKLEFETRRDECIVLPDVTQLEPHQDPRTGDTDKYFLGDRFHEKTYPHSSELCRYHDINLCKELSAAKTSSQEVLNSTRNWRRLRTTCTQNAETHLLYNWVVMDRAHNRRLVHRQAEDLGVEVSSRHPDYLHFV